MVRTAGSVQLRANLPGPVTNADRLCGGPEGHSGPPLHGVNPHAGVGLVHSPIMPNEVQVHVISHVAAAAERMPWKATKESKASDTSTVAAERPEHIQRRDGDGCRWRGAHLRVLHSSGSVMARFELAGNPRACDSRRPVGALRHQRPCALPGAAASKPAAACSAVISYLVVVIVAPPPPPAPEKAHRRFPGG